MSFRTFKETLKSCTTSDAGDSSQSFKQAISSSELADNLIHRKPPKVSIIQQLKRLENPHVRQIKLQEQRDQEAKRGEGLRRSSEPGPGVHFSLPTGPFQPLILSPPSETPVVQVPAAINCRLLEHQREGVKFLYNLYKKNHGGVLGDDMGLGKTIQIIAFLSAVFGKDLEDGCPKIVGERHRDLVLIICPTSVMQNWENEFFDWASFKVAVYHGQNRDLILDHLDARGIEVVITSFDTFRIHDRILLEIHWDIVIVDEAHRLKNEKSQLYKSVSRITTTKRFGLTGTIMQNRILELFNLFDWVAPGSLGTREHFRDFYDEPLKHGQRLSAPERFVKIAEESKKHLTDVLSNYLLRRTKEETIGHLMQGKEDNVVFCEMSKLQKSVYRRTLELPEFQCLINKDLACVCGSPLTQVECCKRIVRDGIIWSYLHRENIDGCDSCPFCLVLPCLIKLQQISNHLELIKPNPRDDLHKQQKDAEFASAVFGTDIDLVGGNKPCKNFMGLSDVEHCGKMQALEKLMLSWISQGDKILLFSYSVRMLNILEKFLIRKGYFFSRLDGSTPMSCRQSLVDDFNSCPSKQVFLASTRAGGLGLNLVSANRVVIFDPNWNPSHDLQAQDRSFRYGQRRHVVVFRLLAAGSLEELVYSRQVYKQQLSNVAVSGKMEQRYFEGVQDCKQFKGELFGISNLFRDLSDKVFTREIIELHERQGSISEYSEDRRENIQEAAGDRFLGFEDMIVSPNSKLVDLGIIYAHRNEDVVNSKPMVQEVKDLKFIELHTGAHCTEDGSGSCRGMVGPSDMEKETEFRLMAQFMGMEVLYFSRWLLSASYSQRKKVLQDYIEYRKHKKKVRFD